MQTFKELTIRRSIAGNMPTLDLNGQWLNEIGFTNGTLVSVSYQDSCLTLCTSLVDTNCLNVLQVTNRKVQHRPRTYLVLDWWLLRKYGFNVGDKVGLSLSSNTIQISKITRYTTEYA
jgi:hypothetical protein